MGDLVRTALYTTTACVLVWAQVWLATVARGLGAGCPWRTLSSVVLANRTGCPYVPQRKWRLEHRKETHSCKAGSMEWAASKMQGWRPQMEDVTCSVQELPAPLTDWSLFAVFD